MSDPQPPSPPSTCMFCIKQFPVEVKARMRARAALERKTLRTWLVGVMQRALTETMRETRKR